MPDDLKCKICISREAKIQEKGYLKYFDCPLCGYYRLEFPFTALDNLTISLRRKLLRFMLEENGSTETPTMSVSGNAKIDRAPNILLEDRLNGIMQYALTAVANAGEKFGTSRDLPLMKAGFCLSEFELRSTLSILKSRKLINSTHDNDRDGYWFVTAEGMDYLLTPESQSTKTSQVFVAMSFDRTLDNAYSEAISRAIIEAGYKPQRIDKKHHTNSIDDEIISEIRRSRFMVADFTDNRAGVYFESGFALGLGQSVIWTCHKKDLEQVHFDLRQRNMIPWTDLEELRKGLYDRVIALHGVGPEGPGGTN